MMDSRKVAPVSVRRTSGKFHYDAEGNEDYQSHQEGESMRVAATNQFSFSSACCHIPVN